MAKRSDLSQRLLDDLRLRKEQMATSHTSNYSKQKPRSSSEGGDFRKPIQEPRSVKTRQMISSSKGDQNKWFSTKHNRPLINEGASKEIVSVGRARNSDNIGDLSMELTFALENGATLGKLTSSGNPVLGFLHHIGRSADFGQMDSSSSIACSRPTNSSFPTISHLHIKEISKGIQKLNLILRACSNDLNFDRFSMDIGKELLKGAMDLDESLRMLVNLQEASEHMISPKRKQRIRLLEDEDDVDTTIKGNKHKQVNQPKYSFNGPSRGYAEDARKVTKVSLLNQQLLALPYSTETVHFRSNNNTPTKSSSSVSHRRSVSCGPDSSTLTASPEPTKHSNSSNSKTGKGRIPSVIAKLMGLEELPPNTDPKNGAEKDRVLKPERVSKDAKQTEGRVKKEERTLMDYKSPSQRTQTPRLQGLHANIYATPGTSLSLAADKFLVPHNGSLKFVFHEETANFRGPKDVENMNISTSKPTIKINEQQMNANPSSKITGIQQDKQGKERKQEKSNPRDWKTIEKGVDEAFISDYLQRMVPQANKNQEAADSKQDRGIEKHIRHKEKTNADFFYMSSNLQKAPNDSGSRQPRESYSQGAKLHQEEQWSQNRKVKLQVNYPKGTGALLKNSQKPTHDIPNFQKKLPHMDHATAGERSSNNAFNKMPSKGSRKISHNEDLINDGITTNNKLNIRSPDERSGAQADSHVKKVTISTPPQMLSETVHVQPRQEKLSSRDMHKRVISQKRDGKVDEVVTRENRSTNTKSQPLKQQISVSQLKQQKVQETHRSKKAETSISMSRKAKASKPMNLVPKENAEPNSTFNNTVGDSCQSPREKGATAPLAMTNDKTSGVSNSLQAPGPKMDKDEITSSYSLPVQLKGPSKEGMFGIIKSSPQEHQKGSGKQSLLTESEYHLKQMLQKSPIFLNRAEALLGLLIPVDILHASVNIYKDDDSKLVFDFCYEVMKRKGRRKELTFHPCTGISIRSVMPKDLDDLVKELHENLEDLKFFNQDSSDEYDAAIYLHKMLERDIQNKNPDLNCMWDFGWSETMFAYPEQDEVIQDVEKFVLNGLIDEILEDILQESLFNRETKTKL